MTTQKNIKEENPIFQTTRAFYNQECKASIQKFCINPSTSSDSAKPHPQAPIASHLIKSSCLSSASLDKSNILTHPSARLSAQKLGSFLPLSADVYLTSMLFRRQLTAAHNTLPQYPLTILTIPTILSQYSPTIPTIFTILSQYSHNTHNTHNTLSQYSQYSHNTLTIPSQLSVSQPSTSPLSNPPPPFLLKGDP